jgi:transmembrane protein 126A
VLKKYDCPLCLQTRAALIQAGIGLIYPLMLAPMTSLMYATRHFTVRIPFILEQPKEWLKLMIKLTRSTKGKSAYILVANLIAGTAVTALEFKEYDNMQRKFDELEKQIESGTIEK